ncbi:MAG: amidohydrolase [Eubacteriales bacterium]|nr:amidohydrolase [Eubacteriales bacterium]
MEAGTPKAEAVAVRDKKIAAVGVNAGILALRKRHTQVIDAGGRSILPGFNDSHLHLYGYALNKGTVDLDDLTSIGGLQEKLIAHIKVIHPLNGTWITGRGWDQTGFREGRMPDRHDLDRVSADYPIALKRKCGHISVLNTRAFREAGIFEHPPKVPGGMIELGGDGKPTGILKENAMDLARPPAGDLTSSGAKRLISLAASDFVKAGLTSVQTDDLGAFGGEAEGLFKAYRELADKGKLPLRVNEQMLVTSPEKLRSLIAMGYTTGFGDDRFRIGPLKILADGSLGGRSAWLRAPYADDPGNRGIALHAREQLQELVVAAHQAGMQVAAHAIGDRAIDAVLEVFREAQAAYPDADPRFRIIHASLSTPDLLDRMKSQGVSADVQPGFIPSDLPFIEGRLGTQRASLAYCFKDFLRRGIHIAGSSDCPVEDYRPLMGIYHAVTRRGHDGQPLDGWLPGQKLSLHEAIYAYTMGSAYNAFEEGIKGSIRTGKLADLVILSEDIEEIPADEIRKLKVERTIMGGETVYAS